MLTQKNQNDILGITIVTFIISPKSGFGTSYFTAWIP